MERSIADEKPARRTQEARSAETRAALLDATVETLIEDGYERTSTSRVAERAGLSRGAHLHHFQTRATLVAAAIERLADRRSEELAREAERIPEGPERASKGLDLLWRQFSAPLFAAAVDLGAAARTDPELRRQLEPVERRLNRETLLLCRRMFAGDEQNARLDPMIVMALSTIRGLAMLPLLSATGRRDANANWKHCRERLVDLLAQGS